MHNIVPHYMPHVNQKCAVQPSIGGPEQQPGELALHERPLLYLIRRDGQRLASQIPLSHQLDLVGSRPTQQHFRVACFRPVT